MSRRREIFTLLGLSAWVLAVPAGPSPQSGQAPARPDPAPGAAPVGTPAAPASASSENGTAAAEAAEELPPPEPPNPWWSVVSLDGRDYVTADDVARFYAFERRSQDGPILWFRSVSAAMRWESIRAKTLPASRVARRCCSSVASQSS